MKETKIRNISKINNNIDLKTRKSIGIISTSFVNKLFSVYQLKNYIFGFVRFVYDRNNNFEEDRNKNNNLFSLKNIVNNNYYLNNNINNLYSLRNIDYYINKFI
ncbi:MAG: hypothetical protein J6C55_01760, partial [Oscillospiraceae bacterium]|nr:hypothetical protein [Oscillospiraceae bacterium]